MEKYFDYHGKQIHYTASGNGNSLVLLHGFTESLDIWDDFTAELSKTNHVICIDLPGHGKSECIGDVQTMEEMADIIKLIMDEEQIAQTVIIGHSMGGYAAMAFAEKHKAMLKGLGLFHSTAFADSEDQRNNRLRSIEVIRNNHQGFLSAFIPDLFAACNREKYVEEINKLVEASRQMSEQSVIACMHGMAQRSDKTHVLADMDFPILFIGGYEDSRVPMDIFKSQMLYPKQSSALLLKDTGHMGYIEEAERTLNFIKKYMDECYKN